MCVIIIVCWYIHCFAFKYTVKVRSVLFFQLTHTPVWLKHTPVRLKHTKGAREKKVKFWEGKSFLQKVQQNFTSISS